MNLQSPRETRSRHASAGFTLVELLSVVAIMAIVMGILAMSLSQTQGRAVQVAAAQVASGLNLTRQLAVNRNTTARFIISSTSPAATASILPPDPFQYWAVVYSNRESGNWILARDWEKLPTGTVFMNLLRSGYSPLTWQRVNADLASPETPVFNANPPAATRWKTFSQFANFPIALEQQPNVVLETIMQIPFVGFDADGGASAGLTGVGLAEGVVTPSGELALRSTNNVFYVEVDPILGKATVRPRESYDREN